MKSPPPLFVIRMLSLFGYARATLHDVRDEGEVKRLLGILGELGAVKLRESHTPAGEVENYWFRYRKSWLIVVVEEYEPVKLIARPSTITQIQAEIERTRSNE